MQDAKQSSYFPCSSSWAEKAVGGPGGLSDSWWVGWASAGVCTLGWLSLAVRTGAAQRQAKLMQRGPIVAGPVEGMQLCWPLPSGSSREVGKGS